MMRALSLTEFLPLLFRKWIDMFRLEAVVHGFCGGYYHRAHECVFSNLAEEISDLDAPFSTLAPLPYPGRCVADGDYLSYA